MTCGIVASYRASRPVLFKGMVIRLRTKDDRRNTIRAAMPYDF